MAMPVIASNVVTKIKIHKALRFRNEDEGAQNEDKTLLVRELGNVTEDSEFTFEYGLKPIDQLLEMEDLDLTQIKDVPFQAQISYTGLDGGKYIRVITNQQPISNNRVELEQKMDHGIMMQNCTQVSSKMARQGDYRGAQSYQFMQKKHIKQNI